MYQAWWIPASEWSGKSHGRGRPFATIPEVENFLKIKKKKQSYFSHRNERGRLSDRADVEHGLVVGSDGGRVVQNQNLKDNYFFNTFKLFSSKIFKNHHNLRKFVQ